MGSVLHLLQEKTPEADDGASASRPWEGVARSAYARRYRGVTTDA